MADQILEAMFEALKVALFQWFDFTHNKIGGGPNIRSNNRSPPSIIGKSVNPILSTAIIDCFETNMMGQEKSNYFGHNKKGVGPNFRSDDGSPSSSIDPIGKKFPKSLAITRKAADQIKGATMEALQVASASW